MPGTKHACPIIAACWSPAMPMIGIGAPRIAVSVSPNDPAQSRISGINAAGMLNRRSMSGSHWPVSMLHNMVRLALVASVAWILPPVRRQTSQVSTVPNASLPACASARAPGVLSSSQAILVALK